MTVYAFLSKVNIMTQGLLSIQPHGPNRVRKECCKCYFTPSANLDYASLILALHFFKFIEALSPAQDLRISKNTLESVTQHVNCYRVDNLRHKYGYTFILMDTPGFLDSKISESHITVMVKEKLDDLR